MFNIWLKIIIDIDEIIIAEGNKCQYWIIIMLSPANRKRAHRHNKHSVICEDLAYQGCDRPGLDTLLSMYIKIYIRKFILVSMIDISKYYKKIMSIRSNIFLFVL